MNEDKVTAFQITDFDGFFKSIKDEAFTDSAMLVGKKFFYNKKSMISVFKKHVVHKKDILMPPDKDMVVEIEKLVFSTADHKDSHFIMPKDMEYLIGKLSNQITYNIMSKLTDADVLEMCFSTETQDIIWRLKK